MASREILRRNPRTVKIGKKISGKFRDKLRRKFRAQKKKFRDSFRAHRQVASRAKQKHRLPLHRPFGGSRP